MSPYACLEIVAVDEVLSLFSWSSVTYHSWYPVNFVPVHFIIVVFDDLFDLKLQRDGNNILIFRFACKSIQLNHKQLVGFDDLILVLVLFLFFTFFTKHFVLALISSACIKISTYPSLIIMPDSSELNSLRGLKNFLLNLMATF